MAQLPSSESQKTAKWLTPPERRLANRAVERYQSGQLPAFDRAVARGGLASIPFLVSAQLDILIAGVTGIVGVVILYLSTTTTAQVVSTVLLIVFGIAFCLGVVRLLQGLSAKRQHVRGQEPS